MAWITSGPGLAPAGRLTINHSSLASATSSMGAGQDGAEVRRSTRRGTPPAATSTFAPALDSVALAHSWANSVRAKV